MIELAAGLASNAGAEMFAVHTFLDHAVYNRLELKLNNVYNTRRDENMCRSENRLQNEGQDMRNDLLTISNCKVEYFF